MRLHALLRNLTKANHVGGADLVAQGDELQRKARRNLRGDSERIAEVRLTARPQTAHYSRECSLVVIHSAGQNQRTLPPLRHRNIRVASEEIRRRTQPSHIPFPRRTCKSSA